MKKFYSVGAILLVIILLIAPSAHAASFSRPIPDNKIWSHYKGDASAIGYVDEYYVKEPKLIWSHDQGSNVHGNGVVVNGVLYMPDEVRVVQSGCPYEFGRFRAYNYYTGEIIWQKGSCGDYVGMFTGQESVAYGFNKIFFNDEGFSSSDDAQTHAVDPLTGNVIWTRNDLGYHTSSSPVVTENNVVVIADSKLYGLSPETGATLWSIDLQYGTPQQEMAYYKDTLYLIHYVSGVGPKLYLVNPEKGETNWTVSLLGSNINATFPVVTPQGVLVGSDHTFAHYSSEGNLIWTYQIEGSVTKGAAIDGSLSGIDKAQTAFVTWSHYPSPLNVNMSRVNLETGEVMHVQEIETYGNQFASPIVLKNNVVVVSTYFGHVKFFDYANLDVNNDWTLLWDSGEFDGGGASVTPIVYNDRILAVGKNGIMKQWQFAYTR